MNHVILYENFREKREFIFLVGPPGSGKSFYVNTLRGNYIVINRDEIATEIANREGFIYRDMYRSPYNYPESLFYENRGKKWVRGYEKFGEIIDVPDDSFLRPFYAIHFKKLFELNNEIEHTFNYRLERYLLDPDINIVLDLTNQTKKVRKPILDKINKRDFKIIAVIFNEGGILSDTEDLLIKVNQKRDIELEPKGKHKKVPEDTIKNYIKIYEPPTKLEGFNEIVKIDNRKELQKYIDKKD